MPAAGEAGLRRVTGGDTVGDTGALSACRRSSERSMPGTDATDESSDATDESSSVGGGEASDEDDEADSKRASVPSGRGGLGRPAAYHVSGVGDTNSVPVSSVVDPRVRRGRAV
jgi:hypothetical protein